MKRLGLAVILLSLSALGASGQTRQAPASAQELAANKVADALVIHDADLKPIVVFEWERNGALLHAWPGDGKEPPYDAAKVQVKLYNFPTGQLRKLTFGKGTRTPWHVNESDLVVYLMQGRQVEFVNEEVSVATPGDATFRPEGVLHKSESLRDTVRGEFAFAPQHTGGSEAVFRKAAQSAVMTAADRIERGHNVMVFGKLAADAPAAARYAARRYDFPDHILIEAHLPKGQVLPEHANVGERLVYVVSGRLRITTGKVRDEVAAGDMFRVASASRYAREALEDSVTVELNGSKAPPTP